MAYDNCRTKEKRMMREEIEKRCTEILQQHGLFSLPIDPVKLANKEGIKVHNAAFSDDSISGMVARRGRSITMLVNQSDPPYRKRFSIAHELGHHFLHLAEDGEIVTKKIDLFRVYIKPEDEEDEQKRRDVEANQFAGALLMPESLVKEIYKKTESLTEMAQLFNVSEEAMGIRLEVLRLI